MKSELAVYFHWNAWEDYIYWRSTDKKLFSIINRAIISIQKQNKLAASLQKPLKGELTGYFSRNIDKDNRLVFKIEGSKLIIACCRYHIV